MRLLRCHIDNFGKLQDYTVDFAGNPTMFLKPNGWGKSTLAAFVKVMFYGFANEKKRGNALERERLRYKPWQGGACGGELEFEAGGRQYRLNRTFGAKESEDTFTLYDAVTNLRSEDFSRNIGEELFQINRESFTRTIFLAQSDCATGTTDSINAKIGNLADNLDDLNRYEKVQQVLKDLRNSLTPSRKTGVLRQRRDEMAELKDELRRRASVEGALTELEGRLADCREERDRLAGERGCLQEQWELAVRQQALAAKRQHYESILSQCRERQQAVERVRNAFGGRIPDRALLEEMQGKRRDLIQQESEMQAAALGDEDRRDLARVKRAFSEGIPEDVVLEQGRELSDELDRLREEAAQSRLSGEERQEMKRLEERFAGWQGSSEELETELDECLRQCELCSGKRSGLDTKRATLDSLRLLEESTRKSVRSGRRAGQSLLMIAGAVMLVGALYLLMMSRLIGLLPAVGGIILMIAGACAGGRKKDGEGEANRTGKVNRTDKTNPEDGPVRAGQADIDGTDGDRESGDMERRGMAQLERQIAEDEAQIARAEHRVETLAATLGLGAVDWETGGQWIRETLYNLKNDWRRLQRLRAREQDYRARNYEERIAGLRGRLSELLGPYVQQGGLPEGKAGQVIAELESDRYIFRRLTEQEQRFRKAYRSCTKLQAQIEHFLAEYGQGESGNPDAALQKMTAMLAGYESDTEELSGLLKVKEEFEAANDVAGFGQEPEQAGAEELKASLTELDGRLEVLGENIHSYLMQLDERQQELEELQRTQERLDELQEAYDRDYEYYCNLERTSEYLALAKESLSARYIGPVLNAFKRYYAFLDEGTDADFRMDTDICVTRREAGEQRDVRAFSAGSRDLIYIALRMALVDAMYQKEKPFIIFDDSFVNLDGERMAQARRFLREIAKEYQVLYFTCHESRM